MKEIYLVDGYNVINYWQEFNGIRENDLEHARDLLVHRMSEFMAFHGYDGTVVFDAMDVAGPEEGQQEEIRMPKSACCLIQNPFHTIMNEPTSDLKRLIQKMNLLYSL